MPTFPDGEGRLVAAGDPKGWLGRNSVPLAFYGSGSVPLLTADGRTVSYARIYETQPWVAACVNLLAKQIARLPLKTFEMVGDDRERARDHPLSVLLAAPGQRRSATDLKFLIGLDLLVQGNSLWWKKRGRGVGSTPDQLWHIDWRCLSVYISDGVIEFFKYTGSDPSIPDYLAPSEVVHFAWETVGCPVGVSPLSQLGVTIRSEDAAQRYTESSFRNGARLGVAAILDKTVNADKAVRDGVRDEITLAHGGIDNSFKPIVLGGGVTDVKTLGNQTAVEAELIDQRKLNRDEIAAVYGAPQPLVGILDHATYSNVAEMHRMLYVTVLGPPLALIADRIGAQLIADEPTWVADKVFCEFDLGEVLKGDTVERMRAYAIALVNGVLTLNDVRRMENLKPYVNKLADEPLIQVNNIAPLGSTPDRGGTTPAGPKAAEILARALRDMGLNGQSDDMAEQLLTALRGE